ncbi:MAG: hypothetical protein WC421_06630 [Elusimicrobiales bacterium]
MAGTTDIYHGLESKAASLKSAVRLLRDCPPEEKREMIALMREAAQDIQRYLAELEKILSA